MCISVTNQLNVKTHTQIMGKVLSKVFGNKELRVLMLGLDGAGKTAILYKLKSGKSVITLPTVGFNVATVTHRKVKFTIWDGGGHQKTRSFWRHYYTGTEALIFVVDSADRDRIDEARRELRQIMNDREMSEVNVLVFANKQDQPNAMTEREIQDKLGLRVSCRNMWCVQSACATTGDGLLDGLSWLLSSSQKS